MFKTRTHIYQSIASLDLKTLVGKILHHLDPEIKEMMVRGVSIQCSTLAHDLLAAEI